MDVLVTDNQTMTTTLLPPPSLQRSKVRGCVGLSGDVRLTFNNCTITHCGLSDLAS